MTQWLFILDFWDALPFFEVLIWESVAKNQILMYSHLCETDHPSTIFSLFQRDSIQKFMGKLLIMQIILWLNFDEILGKFYTFYSLKMAIFSLFFVFPDFVYDFNISIWNRASVSPKLKKCVWTIFNNILSISRKFLEFIQFLRL